MATTTSRAGVVFPPRDLSALLDLGRFLELHTEPALLLRPGRRAGACCPRRSTGSWSAWWRPCARARLITLVPRTQRLTTQEAADFLGVSRPTLVKLLEDGKIPYEQPGRHRRILFTDLLAYLERQQQSAAPPWTG